MSKIEVRVDKRIELISILLLLTGYKSDVVLAECKYNKEYRQTIFNYFKNYKNEKAITLLNSDYLAITKKNNPVGVISRLCSFSLLLDEDYNPHFEYDEWYNNRHWKDLAKAIKNFVKKTEFESFYNNNLNLYQQLIEDVRSTTPIDKMEKFLNYFYSEDFTKKPKHLIHLSLIITNVAYGLSTYLNEDFCIFPLSSNYKYLWFIGSRESGSTIIHEFSHPIINPLVDKYCTYEKNFYVNIKEKFQTLPYSWDAPDTITDEHIVRALQVVYLKKCFKDKPQFAINQLNHTINVGFMYVPLFVDELEFFYDNRKKYKNFEEYLPTLLENVKVKVTAKKEM